MTGFRRVLFRSFHRNLLGGGVFAYPAHKQSPKGKLRLLYECNPLAFIAKEAGGAAFDGVTEVLEIQPTELHQRSPIYIGSRDDIETAREFLSRQVAEVGT